MQPQNNAAPSPDRVALTLVPQPNRITELRGMHGLTLTDVAEKIGARGEDVASWERQEQEIPPEHRQPLAALFHVQPAWLLGTERQVA